MPRPEPEGGAPPAYMALDSLPVDIPWIPGATATYDLIRCLDLTGTAYDQLMAPYIAEEERVVALQRALPSDAPDSARAELEAAYEANLTAGAVTLLGAVRCQLHGINPTPDPAKPATWRHLHPRLLHWLAHHGRQEARDQLTRPLGQLRART